MDIDISKGFNPSRFKQLSNLQTYNFYYAYQSLRPTPGYAKIKQTSYGNTGRKSFYSVLLGRLLVVIDSFVYAFDNNNDYQILNPSLPLSTQSGVVFIAENDVNQVAISDGQFLFIYDLPSSSFSRAPIPDGVTAGMVDFQDTYFILNNSSTNQFYISANNNGLSWDPLEYTRIQNKTVGLAAFNRALMVFGTNSTDIYYNAGVTPFPYQRANTVGIEYGCMSPDSIAKGFGFVFWLGINKNSEPVLLVSDSGQPVPISTENVAYFLDTLKHPEICDAFVFRLDGIIFYQINFIYDNVSLLFNMTEKKFSTVTDADSNVSPIRSVARFNETDYAVSRSSGFLYQFDLSVTTQDDRFVRRGVITDNFVFRNKKVSMPKLSMYLEQGIERPPNLTDSIPDAECYLSISTDKGVTFTQTRRKKFAPLGNRKNLFDFFNLGSNRFWTFKMEFVSPYRICLFSVDCEVMQ